MRQGSISRFLPSTSLTYEQFMRDKRFVLVTVLMPLFNFYSVPINDFPGYTPYFWSGRGIDLPRHFDEVAVQKLIFCISLDAAGVNFADKYAAEDVEHSITGNMTEQFQGGAATFAEMKLDEKIVDNIERMQYRTPTPIQRYAVPVIQGEDAAQTA